MHGNEVCGTEVKYIYIYTFEILVTRSIIVNSYDVTKDWIR